MSTPKEILKRYWGFTSFRTPQEEIINSILNDKDTFALLPTGGGKSICFQVPALLKDGVCIVISPLVALINDQIKNLKSKNIKAIEIKSGSSQDEIITLFDNIQFGNYKFFYISPERLQSKFIQSKIAQLNVSMVAIDEAHCISEWGHDFRPSYRHISVLREIHPNVNFIALTATATEVVLNDVVKSLKLDNPSIYKKSFFRANLSYSTLFIDDKLQKIKQLLTKINEPIIIYVNSRKKSQEISNYLNKNDFYTSFYHGGMSTEDKKKSFDNWFSEKTPIIVATNAFGMGIDKPNVRMVLHYNLPYSIENYVQEAGRAGRDGDTAYSIVLTNKSDIDYSKKIIKDTQPTLKEIKLIHRKLYQNYQIAIGELIENEFDFELLSFCEKYQFNTVKTFNTLLILSSFGIIEFNPNTKHKSKIQFLITSNELLNFINSNKDFKHFIHTLLRMYSGVFEQEVTINEFYLAKTTGITSSQVFKYLEFLEEHKVLNYTKATKNGSLFFLQPRDDDRTINRFSKQIRTYLDQKNKKNDDLTSFIENNKICRSIQILKYFGETSTKTCNSCDVCRNKKSNINHQQIEDELLILIKNHNSISSRRICDLLDFQEQEILVILRSLLSEEKLTFKNNEFQIK